MKIENPVTFFKGLSAKQKVLWGILGITIIAFVAVGALALSGRLNFANVFADSYWPPSCSATCPNVFVDCKTDAEIERDCGKGAWACAEKGCYLHIPNSICDTMGIPRNKFPAVNVYRFDKFQQISQCQRAGLSPDSSYIDKCCALRHELAHICDRNYDRSKPGKEVFAENAETKCRDATTQYYCGGNPPRWNEATCKQSCRTAEARAYDRLWDTCMYGRTLGKTRASTAICCECTKSCQDAVAAKNQVPKVCQKWFGQINKANACRSNSVTGAGHSCNYYGLSGSFNPCTSCGPGDLTLDELAGLGSTCPKPAPEPDGEVTVVGKVTTHYAGSILPLKDAVIQAFDASGEKVGGAYTVASGEYSLSFPYNCWKKQTCTYKLQFRAMGVKDGAYVCYETKEQDLPPLAPPHKEQYIFREIDENLDMEACPSPTPSPSPSSSPSPSQSRTPARSPVASPSPSPTPSSISSVIQE